MSTSASTSAASSSNRGGGFKMPPGSFIKPVGYPSKPRTRRCNGPPVRPYKEESTSGGSGRSRAQSSSTSTTSGGTYRRMPFVANTSDIWRTPGGYSAQSGQAFSNLGKLFTPATTNTTTPKSSTRTCVEALDSNTVISIVEGRGQARGEVGMACLNLHTSNIILCQFTDTQTYHKVIAKVNIFRPHEILMPTTCCEEVGTPSQLYLQLRKEVSNVVVVPIQRRIFSESKGLTRIKQLVVSQFATVIHLITQKYYCLAAAAALLKYVELVQSIIFSPQSMKIEFQGSEKTCMIDSITAQHLELLQNNHQPVSAHSLLGILSNCRTPGGSRLLRMNILQPPCDLKLIEFRLDCIQELMDGRELLYGLQDVLGRLPVDIEHIIATLIQIPKVDNVRLTEQRINYIIALKHILELLPSFVNILEPTQKEYFQSIREDFMSPVFGSMTEKIAMVINEESQVQKGYANMKRQRCFAVKADINPILDIARKAYCEIIDDMNQYVVDLSQKMNMPFRLSQNNKRGFFVQLMLPGRGDLMPKLPNYFLQVRKQRNIVTFTTEFLVGTDHRSQEISKEIENISAIVVSELLTDLRSDIGSLYKISEAVAQIDVLYALANYSLTTLRCVRPSFSETITSIRMGRHPVLDSVSNLTAVPNNTFLSVDSNFSIITGPNMSGKTTYLKQVATLQILAQLGSFVPAEAATFRIASNIFSRIGTGDNIEGSASSFALEMTEMNYILENINDDSLVIIDELGRATSVEEGTAMSWVMAEALLRKESFVLFATHFLFLTKLESLYRNALNYTMETEEWVKAVSVEDVATPRRPRSKSSNNILDPPFASCKLKYNHVLKRGVTKIEFYGLKLANNTSFPVHVVQKASEIALRIIRDRKKTITVEPVEKRPTEHSLYLLASQLRLASELSETMDSDTLSHYLDSLKQEFLTTFGPKNKAVSLEELMESSEEEELISGSSGAGENVLPDDRVTRAEEDCSQGSRSTGTDDDHEMCIEPSDASDYNTPIESVVEK